MLCTYKFHVKCIYHRKQKQGDARNLWEGIEMFVILIVVMVSQVYAYVQIHQNKHIKICNFYMLSTSQ